ncbi:hypothetical protein V6Z11_A11G284800 [Gossypium hirsutum]
MAASSVHGSMNKTLIQIIPQNPIFGYKTLVLKKASFIADLFEGSYTRMFVRV